MAAGKSTNSLALLLALVLMAVALVQADLATLVENDPRRPDLENPQLPDPEDPQRPDPENPQRPVPENPGEEDCWASLRKIGGCVQEINEALLRGQVGRLGPECCRAFSGINENCWAKLFPLKPDFGPELKKHC